jgi:hypothetical protein
MSSACVQSVQNQAQATTVVGVVGAESTIREVTTLISPRRIMLVNPPTIRPGQIIVLRRPTVPLIGASPVQQTTSPKEQPVRKKRSAADMEGGSTATACPNEKAHFVLLAPLGPPGAPRREVHFELEDAADGSVLIKTHVRVFDRVDDADVANIWWSASEMGEIQAREKSAVFVMSYCCEHYASQVLRILQTARTESLHPDEGGHQDETASAATATASPESVWVANSPARGLERDIVAGFKKRKRQVIRKVLESQRVLQTGRHKVTGEIPSLDMQSQLLSVQYHKWSHPMVRFAQVLADGDAQVVVDNNHADDVANGMAPLDAF